MLDEILIWIDSDENIFRKKVQRFEILQTKEQIKKYGCLTLDFELENYYCRFIFWEGGNGHIEILNIKTEITLLDEDINWLFELKKQEPFLSIYERILLSCSDSGY